MPLAKYSVIVILVIFVWAGVAAVDQPVNDQFKNLKVLPKNISGDSLYTLMEFYNKSLDVNCNYCHVEDKKADTFMFASDAKPEKEITRNMIRMTWAINDKYFKFDTGPISMPVNVVTCNTCHRGQPIPVK